MKRTHLHLYWRDRAPLRQFRTAVSLHSHTLYSEESLAFVPRYTATVPILSQAIRQQEERYRARTGQGLDFSRDINARRLTCVSGEVEPLGESERGDKQEPNFLHRAVLSGRAGPRLPTGTVGLLSEM